MFMQTDAAWNSVKAMRTSPLTMNDAAPATNDYFPAEILFDGKFIRQINGLFRFSCGPQSTKMMQSFLSKLLEKKSVCDPVQKYQIRLNVFLFSFLEQKCPQFYPHDFLKNLNISTPSG
jgi:hypothetical protein